MPLMPPPPYCLCSFRMSSKGPFGPSPHEGRNPKVFSDKCKVQGYTFLTYEDSHSEEFLIASQHVPLARITFGRLLW